MVYKLDYIYRIHGGTHVTDGVMDNIVVRGFPGSIPDWVLKKKISQQLIYVLYILYVRYMNISYMHIIYLIYCIYM